MPLTPYLVYGIVKNSSGTTIKNYPVILENTTIKQKQEFITNESGQFLFDCANFGDYSIGDSLTLYVRYGGYTGETTFTISGEGGIQKDFIVYGGTNISTLRTNLWDGIYQTLQTGTYAISTNNIHSAMNDTQISSEGYPQVIIYPCVIKTSSLDFKKELLNKKVNFMIEIYDDNSADLKSLTDEIEYKILIAEEVWNGLYLFNLDIPDNDYDWWKEGDKKIHRATINANFEYIGRL